MTALAPDDAALREDLLGRVEKIRDVLVRTAPASERAGFLDPEAVAALSEVFADGEVPIAAGVAAPMGRARAADGGYAVTGRWKMCSGVGQSGWVRLAAVVEDEPERTIFAVVPRSDVKIHEDSWEAFGLRGTGSYDVSLQDCFVPAARCVSDEKALRGGPQYRLRGLASSSYEHAGISLGIGRRALTELSAQAARKGRPREALLADLGRLTMALDAALALAVTTYEKNHAALSGAAADLDAIGPAGQAVAAYVTQVAVECVETAYRYAGSAGLYTPNPFERLVRDMHGATQHVAVSDLYFREVGQLRVAEHEGPS